MSKYSFAVILAKERFNASHVTYHKRNSKYNDGVFFEKRSKISGILKRKF